ncbi:MULTISPECIES: hypothetical protein [Hyphomicrobiales]|uniref:Uncharacterized protein n=2 Tax=Hyphomicrobiales TaxID=356 RepID=A0A6L3Y9Z4_9HYPH|nr:MULTISPECIES: hypothetical protein [Hyphomicrobiales]KAB2676660.1 hypothetical protein F9L08_26090 [Brucella tritici]MBO0130496.1 hypothetical protein [Agrobacterium burrii]
MSIEITRENGRFHFSYRRHLLVLVAMAFICAGLAGLLGPWWLPILTVILNKTELNVDDGTSYALSVSLVVIGLALLLFKRFVLDVKARQILRDKETLAAHLPDPDLPQAYLRNLVDDHSYLSSQDTAFYHSYSVFLQPKAAFQFKKTVQLYDLFSTQAKALHEFVAANFFVFPSSQLGVSDYRYAMAPHLNEDREMIVYDGGKVEQYNALKAELHGRVCNVQESYDLFLKHLRRIGAL